MKNLEEHIMYISDIEKAGDYIAIGDDGKLYSASYSTEFNTMYFAIPSDVAVSRFVPLEKVPFLTYDNAVVNNVYRVASNWVVVREIYGPYDRRHFKTIYADIAGGSLQAVIKVYPEG